MTATTDPFGDLHRALAGAVLEGDTVAALVLRDLLGELDLCQVRDKPAPPEDQRFHCEACALRGEYDRVKVGGSPGSYLCADADTDNLSSLDGTITLYCWMCHIRGVRTVYATYTVAEALLSAGVLRPSDPSVMDAAMISVWYWNAAPILLRMLSRHGGDEDFVGLIPPGLDVPGWMESGSPFGCSDVSTTDLAGWTLTIGAHA